MADDQEFYRELYTIRRFEETLLENFSKGAFFGTTHTYIGQEANAVGILSNLQEADVVVSNHRCHGHFLARGGDPRRLFAELMGRSTGVCGGRGGSQHLQWENFYSNGVQGGILPIATGMALAEKIKASGAIVTVFMGDGTLGEGVVYEALNMASLWSTPVFFVLENNRIAQTTPIELGVAGSISARFSAFGIPVTELDTSDVFAIALVAQQLIASVRVSSSPQALILHTSRFSPHSKGDDTRPAEEIARLRRERDPLSILSARLEEQDRQAIEAEVDGAISSAFQAALADPFPRAEDLQGEVSHPEPE